MKSISLRPKTQTVYTRHSGDCSKKGEPQWRPMQVREVPLPAPSTAQPTDWQNGLLRVRSLRELV
ncbi:hypothetical protein [Edaphobacter modestus]|uniref:hypothetical protein n=1 Tax=Edaphobacter modestus TaxID=388466 RepID=UPI00102BD82D|nr:hypothetical protein [Edaphobacter modestus]